LHLHAYHADFCLAGRNVALAPGDITLSPANLPSSYALPRPGHHWCIHFQPVRKNRPATCFELPLHLRLGPHAAFATERFRRISALFARSRTAPNPLVETSASLLLQELLLWLADLQQDAAGSQNARPGLHKIDSALEKLVAILQARFTENLSVPDLAEQLDLSQNYLARRFRQRFHTTIPHYLLARRIEHACYLLTSTDMPIQAVGQHVGMPDPQHFNKQFRRFTSQNPSAYRAARQGPA